MSKCLPTILLARSLRYKALTGIWLCLLFCASHFDAQAQRRAWNWYFGDNAGVTFRSGLPQAVSDGALATEEGCASFSNPANGDLYFYTDGVTVYNRSHQPMPNGTGLNGDPSTSQSALILPWPGTTDRFVIVNPAPITSTNPSGKCFCLSFSVVDMRLDGGMGDVVSKNTVLIAGVSEHLTATASCLEDAWWVIAKSSTSPEFYSFKLSTSGFAPLPKVSPIALSNDARDVGQMHTSPDGNFLAITATSGLTQIFRVLRTDGTVFDGVDLFKDPSIGSTYGCSFSRDSRALLVASSVTTPKKGADIYRFTISDRSPVSIENTREHIGFLPGSDALTPMQLGPDGRIYVGRPGIPYLAMITEPSSQTINLVDSAVTLTSNCRSGLPNFIDWILGPHTPGDSSCLYPVAIMDNLEACVHDCLVLRDRSVGDITQKQWNIPGAIPPSSAQNQPRMCFPTPGTYGGSLVTSNDFGADTSFFEVHILPGPVLTTDSIVYSCQGAPVRLNVSGAARYEWFPKTGLSDPFSSTPLANPSVNTTYRVIGSSGRDCDDTATVRVVIVRLKAGPDVATCSGGSVKLTADAAQSYRWEPAEFVSDPTVREPIASPRTTTVFRVTMKVGTCEIVDSLVVSVVDSFEIEIAGPSQACSGEPVTLRAVGGGSEFFWTANGIPISDSNKAVLQVTQRTVVILRVESGDCMAADTLVIDVGGSPVIGVSNDTTVCPGTQVMLTASGDVETFTWAPDPSLESTEGPSVNARPLATTTYRVTGRTSGGCEAEASVTVTVSDGPIIDAGPPRSICSGEATRLAATGTADTFEWTPRFGLDDPSSLTPIASPPSTTMYVLTGRKNGCTMVDSVLVSVSQLSISVGSDVTICAGSAIVLDAGRAAFYTWSPPDGLSDPTISNPIASPKVTTRYRVIANDVFGCVDTAYVTVRVLDTLSVTLEVGNSSAEAGSDSAAVPIFIVVDEADLPFVILRLRAAIVHDAAAYLPRRSERGSIATGTRGNERVSYFEVRNQLVVTPRQRITSIIGTALLSHIEELDIRLEDALWEGLTCPITHTRSGRLSITGCNLQARVLKQFRPTRVTVRPLPSSDVVEVLIEGGEPGSFTMQLVSADGRVLHQEQVIRQFEEELPYVANVDMAAVSSGLYHVVVIAPSGPHASRVLWMR
jgi:hypothetical protein